MISKLEFQFTSNNLQSLWHDRLLTVPQKNIFNLFLTEISGEFNCDGALYLHTMSNSQTPAINLFFKIVDTTLLIRQGLFF